MGVCVDALTLPHLRSLTALNLSYIVVPGEEARYTYGDSSQRLQFTDRTRGYISTESEIFAKLTRERIYLRSIAIGDVTDVFLGYLKSYSGLLEELKIEPTTAEGSDSLAKQFYESVLPKHVNSIQVLDISPRYGGEWCYDNETSPQFLARCKDLRSLAITFASYHSSDFGNMISSLVDLSLTLPHLTEISIRSADMDEIWMCGTGQLRHQQYVTDVIKRSVTSFTFTDRMPLARVPPDIWVGPQLYFYREAGDGISGKYQPSLVSQGAEWCW